MPVRRNDPSARDHAERQHDIFHRAVAHCIGARGAGRRHAAERGVGARINGKEEPAVAQVLVELLAGDPRFDDAVEIVRVDGENIIHPREVERDAAMRSVDMALERRADAERNDRRVMAGAELGEVDHVLFGFGEHHRVRRLVLEPGQRVAMRLADRFGRGVSVAETGGEIGIERGDRFGREAALALADGELGHGASALLGSRKISRARARWLDLITTSFIIASESSVAKGLPSAPPAPPPPRPPPPPSTPPHPDARHGAPTLVTRKVRSSPSSSRTDTYSPTLKAWSPKRKPSSSSSFLAPLFHSNDQVEPPRPPAR